MRLTPAQFGRHRQVSTGLESAKTRQWQCNWYGIPDLALKEQIQTVQSIAKGCQWRSY